MMILCVLLLLIDVSGEIQMDFKAERISDFMVYYLSQKNDVYEEYMRIPLSSASYNVTDCVPWMVWCSFNVIGERRQYLVIYFNFIYIIFYSIFILFYFNYLFLFLRHFLL